MKQSQSANFFNNRNNGKEDFEDERVKATKASIKPVLRGRQRGRSKFRNANAVTSAPSRNSVTAESTQKAFTAQQSRQTFTNTPIVVQPVANSRYDNDFFRSSNSPTTVQTTSRSLPPTTSTTANPKRDETFFDVPKISQKTPTTKLKSAPAQNFDFNSPSSTFQPLESLSQNLFGAIPQRVIIPSKLSPEQRLALQASNNNNFQTTAASFASPTTTEVVPQFNRNQNSNQLRPNTEQKPQQKDFVSLPQKFNFKTQKYEPIENTQQPSTQFYNPNYETKGTEQPFNNNFNLEPTRSGLSKQVNKTYATRQLSSVTHEENKPTTFNPQQYYQSEQSQYQNLSPRGFSLAAQKQQELPQKQTQQHPQKHALQEIRPQITSRSEARNHKKFSTLVPKDQYNPTTFKPNNNFSKKPFDYVTPQKLEKIQNPNKYYSQFTSTQAPSTVPITTTPYPQFHSLNTHEYQHNNFQHQTTRQSNFFSTTTTFRPLADGEEDDGQYRPELYEKDFYRNKAKTTKITAAPVRNTFNNFYTQSTTLKPQKAFNSGEDEFLKTAHSQNIFASGNQLRVEKEREKTVANYNDFSTEKSSPRPFSKPTPVTSTTFKPVKKEKEVKDVSYDYQYYDTNAEQHDYSEFDAVEDFGKTLKKSSSN